MPLENVNLVNLTDKEIVEQIKNGDDRAFGELVNRYEKKVFFIAKRMLNDDDEAWDASQEVSRRCKHIHLYLPRCHERCHLIFEEKKGEVGGQA
jgi:hypothetical protein